LPSTDFTIQADHILCNEHAAAKQRISNQNASTRMHIYAYCTTYLFLRDSTDTLCYKKHRKAHLYHKHTTKNYDVYTSQLQMLQEIKFNV